MAQRIKGITVEIGGDTVGLQKALTDVNKQSRSVQRELNDVQKLLKFDPKNTELLAQRQELLSKAVETTSSKLEQLREAEQQVQEQFERGDIKEEQYRAFQREIADTEARLRSLEGQLERNTSKTQAFGEKMQEAGGKMKDVGGKMTGVGKDLTAKVTAPILGLGAAAVAVGMNFDESMSKVAAVSGATGESFDKLRQQAQDLGKTTQFSASEAASGMEFLARAGFGVEDIYESMPAMLDLAAAGALDLGEAADITSNIMSGFGIEASEAGHIADVLAKAAASANTDVSQLGAAMQPLAPIAKDMGWSMEEATAAVMVLSDAGIQGEKAGTAFATSLGRLAKPTGEMEKTIKNLGIEFFDAQGNMKSMPDVMKELEGATEGMNAQQKSATLTTLFGAEAYKHWSILLNEGSEGLTENTQAMVESEGAAADMRDVMNDNAKGALKEMMSALEGLAITLADRLMPTVEKIIEWVTEWIKKFEEMSPTAQTVILIIAAVVAAIPPLLVMLGLLFTVIGSVMTVMGGLTISIGALIAPILIAVAVIAAIIAIGVLLYKNWDKITEKAGQLAAIIKEKFEAFKKAAGEKMEETKKKIADLWDGVVTFFKNIDLKQIGIDIIKGLINGIGSMAGELWGKAKDLASGIGSSISKALKIGSPSKLMMDIGEFTGEGLVKGLQSTMSKVQAISSEMAVAATPNIQAVDAAAASGQTMTEAAAAKSMVVNMYSPKALDVREANKQFNRTLNRMALMW